MQIQLAHHILEVRGPLLPTQHRAGLLQGRLVLQKGGAGVVEPVVGRFQLLEMASDVCLIACQDNGVLAHGKNQRRKKQQENHFLRD